MAKLQSKNLIITSDVYKSFKGAGYGAAYNALEDAVDNCFIGLDDPRLPEDHVREVVIEFFAPNGNTMPDTIKIYDNGIGMSKDTVSTKLYVTTAVDAKTKIVNGGTSRWGLGYNQFTNYLGEPGRVVTSEVGLENGFESSVVYNDGEVPKMEVLDLSDKQVELELSPVNSTHGTMVEITNVNTSKFVKEWWNPSKNTWYRSMQNRYNRLLKSGKVKITWKLHKSNKTLERILEPGEFFLNNRDVQDDSWKTPGVSYENTQNNTWNIITKWGYTDYLDDDKIVPTNTQFDVKIGRHLSAIETEIVSNLGNRNLLTKNYAPSAVPTYYVYQNDILLGTIKLKASERDGGLAHLNGLFVEIDVPKDYIIPTNTTKNGFDTAFVDELKRQMKPWIETHKGFEPADVKETQWHDAFDEQMRVEGVVGDALRKLVYGKDISVEDIESNQSHEKQIVSSKPDFTYEDDDFISLVEIKDEIASTDVVSQVARYYMNRGGKVDRIVVVARGFKDNVKNEFGDWNKNFNTEFICIDFSQLMIDENKVQEIATKKQRKNQENIK